MKECPLEEIVKVHTDINTYLGYYRLCKIDGKPCDKDCDEECEKYKGMKEIKGD